MLDYFDAHSHISFSEFAEDRDEVLKRMQEEKVGTIVVGTDLKTSREAVLFAEKHENIFATVGLHPHDNKGEVFDEKDYKDLVAHPSVVGIGECGLDYYRIDKSDVEDKKRQKKIFIAQIEFAKTHNKPLMIHGRPSKGSMDAYEDILTILEEVSSEGTVLRGNIHFFVGSQEIAKRFFDLGFTISFTGVLTFSHDYDEVIKKAPISRLLSETDAPFAAPVPHRGKRNEPSYVPLVVRRIAEIREEDPEEIREALLNNAKRVFGF